MIISYFRELAIKYHVKRMARAKTSELRRYHLDCMVKHIKSRNAAQIKRMEQKRGLI